jgi:hypothetical protein
MSALEPAAFCSGEIVFRVGQGFTVQAWPDGTTFKVSYSPLLAPEEQKAPSRQAKSGTKECPLCAETINRSSG